MRNRILKLLKQYAKLVNKYNDEAIEKIIELQPEVEDLIEELESEVDGE
jgi:hypothetical protein